VKVENAILLVFSFLAKLDADIKPLDSLGSFDFVGEAVGWLRDGRIL